MEYSVNKSNINEVFNSISKELDSEPNIIIETKSHKTGKWGMAKLWRSWVAKASEYMANNGAVMPIFLDKNGRYKKTRPFNASDGHELFTMNLLGCDKDGVRLSWAKSSHDGMRAATQGERFHALRMLEEWCTNRGIILFKPRDSEYSKLIEQEMV